MDRSSSQARDLQYWDALAVATTCTEAGEGDAKATRLHGSTAFEPQIR